MLVAIESSARIRHARGLAAHVLANGRPCSIWANGYLFDRGGKLLSGDEIDGWLAHQLESRSLTELLPGMNGGFAVVVLWHDTSELEVGTDRYGTVPVYYSTIGHELLISDDFWEIARQLRAPTYDPDAVLSMVLMGYVTGSRTMLNEIREFPYASAGRFSPREGGGHVYSAARYWKNISLQAPGGWSYLQWRKELARILESVFSRYAQEIRRHGWTAHVSLSSGLDSRLVIGLLARYGVPLQALSYGPPGNEESGLAGQVASALHVPFRFVPIDGPAYLTRAMLDTMTRRVGMHARFTAGVAAELSLHGYDPLGLHLTGHPGNMPTGDAIARGARLPRTQAQAIQQLVNNYALPVFDDVARALSPGTWTPESRAQLASADWRFDAGDPIASMDDWGWRFHFRRLIMGEVRCYASHGKWMLPFCDHELVDFFASVPFSYRFGRRIHIDGLLNEVFVDDLAALAKIPIAGKGVPAVPRTAWRDQVLNHLPRSPVGDWVLRRATRSKRAEHIRTIGVRPSSPAGAEPFAYWWYEIPGFRQFVLDVFDGWGGLNGLLDTRALRETLEGPMPRYFIRLCVPALLTLRSFEDVLASERLAGQNGRAVEVTEPTGARAIHTSRGSRMPPC
jgi:hypothetical protein